MKYAMFVMFALGCISQVQAMEPPVCQQVNGVPADAEGSLYVNFPATHSIQLASGDTCRLVLGEEDGEIWRTFGGVEFVSVGHKTYHITNVEEAGMLFIAADNSPMTLFTPAAWGHGRAIVIYSL